MVFEKSALAALSDQEGGVVSGQNTRVGNLILRVRRGRDRAAPWTAGLAPIAESGDGAGQQVTNAATTLQAALVVARDHGLTVRYDVHASFLDDGHVSEMVGQLFDRLNLGLLAGECLFLVVFQVKLNQKKTTGVILGSKSRPHGGLNLQLVHRAV